MEAQAPADRTGLFSRLLNALPGWQVAFLGSLAWASLMAASSVLFLWYREWQLEIVWQRIAILYFAGGLLAFVPALTVLDLLDDYHLSERWQRFAAALFVFALFTVAATAFLFSQYFRLYFAQWHGPLFSFYGFDEFIFTSGAAVYYFAVGGMRQFFPLGLPALLAFSLWWSRKPR